MRFNVPVDLNRKRVTWLTCGYGRNYASVTLERRARRGEWVSFLWTVDRESKIDLNMPASKFLYQWGESLGKPAIGGG